MTHEEKAFKLAEKIVNDRNIVDDTGKTDTSLINEIALLLRDFASQRENEGFKKALRKVVSYLRKFPGDTNRHMIAEEISYFVARKK